MDTVEVVQYNLFGFMDGEPKSFHEVLCKQLESKPKVASVHQLVLLDSHHIGNLHPVCPECGSPRCKKDGFYKKNPKLS